MDKKTVYIYTGKLNNIEIALQWHYIFLTMDEVKVLKSSRTQVWMRRVSNLEEKRGLKII